MGQSNSSVFRPSARRGSRTPSPTSPADTAAQRPAPTGPTRAVNPLPAPTGTQLGLQYLCKSAGSTGLLSILAPQSTQDRAPIDLTLVIDRSGSMRGSKLGLVKRSITFILSQLNSGDRLALVSYDTNVRTDFELTACTEQEKVGMGAEVAAIRAGSATNLSGALQAGLQLQQKTTPDDVRNSVRSVFLLTDGLANAGLKTTPEIVKLVADAREQNSSVVVHTFGFGDDHNAEMLDAVAKAGGGEYMYVEKDENLGDSFAEALGGLASVVAQSISLTVSQPGGMARPRTQFPVVAEVNGWRVDISDLYAEERRDILVEMTEGVAKFRYYSILSSEWVESTLACSPRDLTDDEATAVDLAVARETTAAAMLQANEDAASGRMADARQHLQDALKQAEAVAGDCEDIRRLQLDLNECLETVQTSADYKSKGSKKLAWMGGGHGKQRSRGTECAY
eukprot:CAMPEP_0204451758 /NCGR_PEP_ID=MMETSP0470-20130426/101013_1 /ASSEMBLY_ACC=CAM_ASM_000385 /TAXON_ID=2969 /ORGANISM="Oxyrrhis marina" /LENGTH=451 /DNA_ID=CAMNT_0051451603 /DNA_START=36 /DNA_END=1388 /DNA_ORIENTATION=-